MKHILRGLTALVVATVVTSTFCSAQIAANNLQQELERLHNQWFNAFDKGEGAMMDKMEISNLVLVNADLKGGIWKKDGPRAGKQKPTGRSTTLSDAQVRQFGDSAILTGVLTIKGSQESTRLSTTVVWIRQNSQWLVASAHWSEIPASK
jgi:hypothetical protein